MGWHARPAHRRRPRRGLGRRLDHRSGRRRDPRHGASGAQILVTLDKDFSELAIVYGRPHAGIVRLVNFRAREQASACITVLARYGEELLAGAIVTASPTQSRIRAPEKK